MTEDTETIKGFRDFSGEEAEKRQAIIDLLTKKYKLYGFEPAETPIIESQKFVQGNNPNDEAVSDIFKLQDKGKRKLALRYEFTFQLKRLAKNQKLPYKRFQIGPVFRDEPVSSNRFRQFIQADVDIIGSTVKEEAEVLALAASVVKELGIPPKIEFNNRKLMNEILEEQGIQKKDRKEVIKQIDKLTKIEEKEVKQNLKKYKAEKVVDIFKKPRFFFKKYKAYEEIEELEKYSKMYGLKINFVPSLARGLSYYNGSIFEIKTPEERGSIAGGGSYMVNGIQSTGLAFGLKRLSKFAKVNLDKKQAIIISIGQDKEAITLSEKLREKDIPCFVMYKISNALEYANSKQIPYVLFIGKEEVSKKKFKLKDMKTGKETFVNEKEIEKKLI